MKAVTCLSAFLFDLCLCVSVLLLLHGGHQGCDYISHRGQRPPEEQCLKVLIGFLLSFFTVMDDKNVAKLNELIQQG